MIKKRFESFYGGQDTIVETRKGTFVLKSWTSHGKLIHNKEYATYKGARVALGKITNGVKEVPF